MISPLLSAEWIYSAAISRSLPRHPTRNSIVALSYDFPGKDIAESPVSADALGGLIDLIADNTISGRIAKDVFAEMFETGKPAKQIVEEKGLRQVTDTGAIDAAIDDIMAKNADKVAEYRGGKDKLLGFFVGQVMKATGGKANPALLNERLKAKLAG